MTPLVLLILLAGPAKPGLQLVGRVGTAQACPVSPERALTCGHVVDPRPFDASVGLYPLLWSDGEGGEGVARPVVTLAVCDLALMAGTFPRWYELAAAPPAIGARLRFVGYDWSNRGRAYEVRETQAKVTRVVAGHLILDRSGRPGSSGACVVDEQERVVGIYCHGHEMESGEEVGRAVGTWGPWVRELLARPEPER